MVKIVCMSDTHGKLSTKVNIPSGDIVIHAGDGSARGSKEQLGQIARRLRETDARYAVYVPGNHDKLFYHNREEAMSIFRKEKIIVLIDELVELMGLRIYGFPWLPNRSGTCQYTWETDDMGDKIRIIPSGLDILVSHGPPYGILDKAIRGSLIEPDGTKYVFQWEHIGNTYMTNIVGYDNIAPRYFICGHVHEARGVEEFGGTKYINCAMCDENNKLIHEPIVLEV